MNPRVGSKLPIYMVTFRGLGSQCVIKKYFFWGESPNSLIHYNSISKVKPIKYFVLFVSLCDHLHIFFSVVVNWVLHGNITRRVRFTNSSKLKLSFSLSLTLKIWVEMEAKYCIGTLFFKTGHCSFRSSMAILKRKFQAALSINYHSNKHTRVCIVFAFWMCEDVTYLRRQTNCTYWSRGYVKG